LHGVQQSTGLNLSRRGQTSGLAGDLPRFVSSFLCRVRFVYGLQVSDALLKAG